MMRRSGIRMLSYTITAFLVLVGLVWQARAEVNSLRRSEEYTYKRALWELSDSVEEVETGLRKALCASSPRMFSACCSRVYAQTLSAQASLGQLPGNGESLEDTAAFLSKTGAYTMALAAESVENATVDPGKYETLSELHKVALELEEALGRLREDVNNSSVSVVERIGTDTDGMDIAASLSDVESNFPTLPTLIYDGPFSDSDTGEGCGVLEEEAVVSQEEAREAVQAFLTCDSLQYVRMRTDEPDVYVFSGMAAGDECTFEVSRNGGHVTVYRRQSDGLGETIRPEEAVTNAGEFLRTAGYCDLEETGRITGQGEMTISFAPVQENVLLYPDIVKVTVSLATGEITGMDATHYWLHHVKRMFPEKTVSAESVMESLSPWLTAQSCRLAVIPREGCEALLCCEIRCTDPDGETCLAYFNAETGAEEEVLILLESDSETLTK